MAIIAIESGYDHTAVSPCHGVGYMQVRSTIWEGHNPYNIHDRYENIIAGTWILRQYANELGSVEAAIPAYNVGIEKVKAGRSIGAQKRYIRKVNETLRRIRRHPRELDTL